MRTHGIGAAQLSRTALRALRANRARSALTMLGVIIGVAAVITMMAVGTGARRSIEGFIAGVGSNLLIVMPGTASTGGVRLAAGSGASLTLDDAVQRLGRKAGVEAAAVRTPYGLAAVDVDKPADLDLVRRLVEG